MEPLSLLVLVVVVALAFDVTNGFHDTANSVAPMIATKAASARVAILIVALANGLGALVASGAVAATIGSGVLNPADVTLVTVLAAISGAIAWNIATWWFGVPCSSSLALVGGLVGAGIAGGGVGQVGWGTVADKAFVPALLAPVVGGVIAIGCWLAITRAANRMHRRTAEVVLRRGQIGTAALQAFAHGTNDAQKTMGVIALALAAAGVGGVTGETFFVPTWVIIACAISLTVGTLAGGWRIIGTMSRGITKLDVAQGTSATAAGGVVLLLASNYGMPVSTTYASVGSIMGAGVTKGVRRVKWQSGAEILQAWAITLPCSAGVAIVAFGIASFAPVLVGGAVLAGLSWMLWRNHKDETDRNNIARPAAQYGATAPGAILART
jgi:PiT family inorganic phosphate transporter